MCVLAQTPSKVKRVRLVGCGFGPQLAHTNLKDLKIKH